VRVSTVLFFVWALLIPASSFAQVEEIKGKLNCEDNWGTADRLPEGSKSLKDLVKESDEIIFGKYVSAETKCFAKKSALGYELVPKPFVTLDTSFEHWSFLSFAGDTTIRMSGPKPDGKANCCKATFTFGFDGPFLHLPKVGEPMILFLKKTGIVGAFELTSVWSGMFENQQSPTGFINGQRNKGIWENNLWEIVSKVEVEKELRLLKLGEEEIKNLLLLGDEAPVLGKALPVEFLLSVIKVLKQNKK